MSITNRRTWISPVGCSWCCCFCCFGSWDEFPSCCVFLKVCFSLCHFGITVWTFITVFIFLSWFFFFFRWWFHVGVSPSYHIFSFFFFLFNSLELIWSYFCRAQSTSFVLLLFVSSSLSDLLVRPRVSTEFERNGRLEGSRWGYLSPLPPLFNVSVRSPFKRRLQFVLVCSLDLLDPPPFCIGDPLCFVSPGMLSCIWAFCFERLFIF